MQFKGKYFKNNQTYSMHFEDKVTFLKLSQLKYSYFSWEEERITLHFMIPSFQYTYPDMIKK